MEDSADTEGGGVSEETGPLRDEPEVVPVDPEAQQRELKQAG